MLRKRKKRLAEERENLHGIEKTKDLVVSFADFISEIDDASSDDKIQMGEWVGILKDALAFGKNVRHLKEIGEEVRDLSESEKQEIVAAFKERFDLQNQEAEEKVESVLVILCETFKIIKPKNG